MSMADRIAMFNKKASEDKVGFTLPKSISADVTSNKASQLINNFNKIKKNNEETQSNEHMIDNNFKESSILDESKRNIPLMLGMIRPKTDSILEHNSNIEEDDAEDDEIEENNRKRNTFSQQNKKKLSCQDDIFNLKPTLKKKKARKSVFSVDEEHISEKKENINKLDDIEEEDFWAHRSKSTTQKPFNFKGNDS